MKKAFKIAYIVLFFTLLCLPMLLMPFFKNDASLEKRSLAKLPSYLEDGRLNLDFSDQFESFSAARRTSDGLQHDQGRAASRAELQCDRRQGRLAVL